MRLSLSNNLILVSGLNFRWQYNFRDLFEPLSETDPPQVDTRRFENLHIQADAHLDRHTDVENAHGTLRLPAP